MSTYDAETGACLRKLRKIAGLTRRQAAHRADCSRRYLRAVERGKRPGSPGFYAQVATVCADHIRRQALAGRS